jgi:hypothetical protein
MSAGMLAVMADSTRDQTLREANRARRLVAALATDNLFVMLSASTLNSKMYIAARRRRRRQRQECGARARTW